MTKKILFKHFIPIILYSCFIFYLSHQESIEYLNFGFQWEDKVKHFIAYLVYGLLLVYPFYSTLNKLTFKNEIILFLIGLTFGISDEFHQYFIPGRYSEFLDVLADGIGVLTGLKIGKILLKIRLNKNYKL